MRARAVRRLLALAIAALAAAAAVAQVSAAGENRRTAEKLVDRTLVCAAGFHGGARVLYLRAQAAYGQGARLDWLAGVYVSTAGNPDGTGPKSSRQATRCRRFLKCLPCGRRGATPLT